jgi:beta-lactamase superfamily II metal-dependent hydrolase
VFSIEMMPARKGDSLWIEYGDPAQPHRALIDGGTSGTYQNLRAKVAGLPAKERRLEVLVITHVDDDHIAGILGLLDDTELGLEIRDLWFNGYRHLPKAPLESLGPVQGEKLTSQILRNGISWNNDFDGLAVALDDDGLPITKALPGSMSITVLSPGRAELATLKPVWAAAVRAAGLDPAEPQPEEVEAAPRGLERLGVVPLPEVEILAAKAFEQDTSEANASTISLLLEYDDRRVLLTGDAHPTVLLAALEHLSSDEPLAVDALQVPHHGSEHNVSSELLEYISSPRYLFSTSGAVHHHPHAEAVARVLATKRIPAMLSFNYRSAASSVWDQSELRERWQYDVVFPAESGTGLRIEL